MVTLPVIFLIGPGGVGKTTTGVALSRLSGKQNRRWLSRSRAHVVSEKNAAQWNFQGALDSLREDRAVMVTGVEPAQLKCPAKGFLPLKVHHHHRLPGIKFPARGQFTYFRSGIPGSVRH